MGRREGGKGVQAAAERQGRLRQRARNRRSAAADNGNGPTPTQGRKGRVRQGKAVRSVSPARLATWRSRLQRSEDEL